jgi:HD superfamily phosphohydrolase
MKKEFRDPVHGDIEFDEFELAMINTPQFQRMRGIRQLGLAHLVYPSAQHSRFEHSLGVAHMSDRIIRAIEKNGGKVEDSERRFTRALALTHDIGHIPFGHTLEDERPVFGKEHHHDCEIRLAMFLRGTELGNTLAALGKDIGRKELAEDLIRVMKHTHEESELDKPNPAAREKLFANIVGNTICADLLDYLKRDPYFTGIQHRYDDRIIGAFKVEGDTIYLDLDERGHLRRSVLSEILHLLRLRYTLGERVYYYPTKSAGSAMISKAVELSGLTHASLAPLRDEELLYILENATSVGHVGSEKIRNPDVVARLVKNIRTRQLHVPAYSISREHAGHNLENLVRQYHDFSNIGERQRVEEMLAQCVGARTGDVIVYCPDEKMASKAAMVNVRWPKDARLQPLQDLSEEALGIDDATIREEISQLKHKHQALWQFTVFVDPELLVKQRDLSTHCQSVFHNIANCSPTYTESPLQALRERQMLAAFLNDANLETIDRNACRELLKGDRSQNEHVLAPDEVCLRLPRLAAVLRAEPAPATADKGEPWQTIPADTGRQADSTAPDVPTFGSWFRSTKVRLTHPEMRRQFDKSRSRLRTRIEPLSAQDRSRFYRAFDERYVQPSAKILAGEFKGNKGDDVVRAVDELLGELRIPRVEQAGSGTRSLLDVEETSE